MTEPGGEAWKQTIYHPFALTSQHGRRTALRVAYSSDAFSTPKRGDIDCLVAAAVWDEAAGNVNLFLTNRDPERILDTTVDLAAFDATSIIDAVSIHNDDPTLTNTAQEPDVVAPDELADVDLVRRKVRVSLPPLSWNLVRVAVE